MRLELEGGAPTVEHGLAVAPEATVRLLHSVVDPILDAPVVLYFPRRHTFRLLVEQHRPGSIETASVSRW